MQGQLILEFTPQNGVPKRLDCGAVTLLSDRVNVTVSHTPIVTYSAENAFLFDTGATDQLAITLVRKNPPNAYDPLDGGIPDATLLSGQWTDTHTWCNRLWKSAISMLINRWQAETDGCKIYFTPVVQVENGYAGTGDLYQRGLYGVNAYIKSESITYNTKSYEVINVSLNLTVGTMCGDVKVVW